MNSFIQKLGPTNILDNSPLYQASKKYNSVQDFFMEEEAINTHVLLRKSQFLNIFVIFLLNSHAQVQIKMFDDLEHILSLNSANKRVLVNLGFQDFFL